MNEQSDSGYIPFNLPDIGAEEIAAVVEVLKSGWLTTGPTVKAFEAEFADYVGARYAVAVNSCTAALHLALEAAGIGPGDEVIVPTLTFAATAEVVAYLRAKPVLADCDPRDLNISVASVRAALTDKTKAIIPVHYAGLPCDLDPLRDAVKGREIAIIEDAAHAVPSRYNGRMIGSISKATCFSFYATKTLTTGEGGMITTDDPAMAERMRIMSLHGISRDAWKRFAADGNWYYEILRPGFKYNLTDIAAALGRVQLRRIESMREKRAAVARAYSDAFRDLPGVVVPGDIPGREHSWHLYVLRLDPARVRGGRDGLIAALKERGIGTSVHYTPLHLHPYYREAFGYKPEDFPAATRAYSEMVSLPLYSHMSGANVARVVGAVREVVLAAVA